MRKHQGIVEVVAGNGVRHVALCRAARAPYSIIEVGSRRTRCVGLHCVADDLQIRPHFHDEPAPFGLVEQPNTIFGASVCAAPTLNATGQPRVTLSLR